MQSKGATGGNDAVDHVQGKGGHEHTLSDNTPRHVPKFDVPDGTSTNTSRSEGFLRNGQLLAVPPGRGIRGQKKNYGVK